MTLGDLLLRIGPDESAWNDLRNTLVETRAALQEFVADVSKLSEALDTALIEPAKAAGDQMGQLGDQVRAAGDAATSAAVPFEHIPTFLDDTARSASDATEQLKEFLLEGLKLAGITLSLEAMKEAVIGSLESFGELQRVGEALTAISGDAEAAAAALEKIPAQADQIGVSITSAEDALQKFARFGIALEQIPAVLDAIASGAVASGLSFETVASSWERMTNTGALMARTLQNAGINMAAVAQAMNMAGASSAEVSAAFKGITDTMDGVSAATQRADILMRALPDSIKGLADKTDDVTKSFQQMKNAVHEAIVNIGADLAAMGQGGGLAALGEAIKAVETVLLGLITLIGESVTFIVASFKIAADAAMAFGKAMDDIASGNFRAAVADIKAGGEQMVTDWIAATGKMQGEFQATGAILAKVWADTTAKVKSDTVAMAYEVDAQGNAIDKSVQTMVSNFNELGPAVSQALLNAQNAFDKAAAAMAAGTGSIKNYETALRDLNAAQEDANNGLENAKTAMLLVADAHQKLAVAAANASTTFKAVVADMHNGAASASQYSSALAALNKAQQELNGGLENAHTATLLAIDDYQKLLVQGVNAQTTLTAVAQAVLAGESSLTQFDQALQRVNTDFMNAHGGAQDFATVVEMIGVEMQKASVAAQNSQLGLQAWLDKLAQGYPVLQNVIDALDKAAGAYEKAHGGALDLTSATDLVTAAHLKLQLAADKANVTLSAAYGLADQGKISYQELADYINKAAQANEALSGSHAKATTAAQTHTTAQQSLNSTLQAQRGILQPVYDAWDVYAQKISGANQAVTTNIATDADWRYALAQAQGVADQFGSHVDAAATNMGQLTDALHQGTVAAPALGSALSGVDAVVNQLSADMLSTAVAAGSLADAVRAGATGFVTGGGQSGTIAGQPGDVVTQRTEGGGIASQITLGTPLQRAQKELADLQAPYQLQQIYDQINKIGQAGTTLQTGAAALSKAVVPFQDAATLAYEAAKAQQVASSGLSSAADAISASSLAAADAANQLASDNSRLAGTVNDAVQVVQSASSTTLLSTKSIMAAVDVVGAMVTAIGDTLAPVAKTFSSLVQAATQPGPAVPGYQPGGSNAMVAWGGSYKPFYTGASVTGQPPQINISVPVQAGTLVGSGGMQELSTTVADTVVKQLETLGIRLTSG